MGTATFKLYLFASSTLLSIIEMKGRSGIAPPSCRAKHSSEGQAVGNCVSNGRALWESCQANSINGRAFEIIASGQFNQWSGIFEVVRSGQAIQWSGIWYFEEKEE